MSTGWDFAELLAEAEELRAQLVAEGIAADDYRQQLETSREAAQMHHRALWECQRQLAESEQIRSALVSASGALRAEMDADKAAYAKYVENHASVMSAACDQIRACRAVVEQVRILGQQLEAGDETDFEALGAATRLAVAEVKKIPVAS